GTEMLPSPTSITARLDRMKELRNKTSISLPHDDRLGASWVEGIDLMIELAQKGPAHQRVKLALEYFNHERTANKGNDKLNPKKLREAGHDFCEALELFVAAVIDWTNVKTEIAENNIDDNEETLVDTRNPMNEEYTEVKEEPEEISGEEKSCDEQELLDIKEEDEIQFDSMLANPTKMDAEDDFQYDAIPSNFDVPATSDMNTDDSSILAKKYTSAAAAQTPLSSAVASTSTATATLHSGEREPAQSSSQNVSDPLRFYCPHCRAPYCNKLTLRTHIMICPKAPRPDSAASAAAKMQSRRPKIRLIPAAQTADAAAAANPRQPPNFQCSQCSVRKSTRAGLEMHMKTWHKFLKCQDCAMIFECPLKFKRHQTKAHGGIRHHKCEHCDGVFTHVSNLKQHVRDVHNTIRHHKCEQCDVVFAQSSNLKQHIRDVHLSCPFSCNPCNLQFFYNSELIKHKKEKHHASY
ncbi:hypothetical protein PENTCL1PPCAC_12821, partial [Pristionchus entomophagus]